MTHAELNAEIERLDREGRRQEVVDLMRKYGLFTDEEAVATYLAGKDES